MANELSGLGGYASMMRTQKNPYERNIATTNAVMNQMPQNGGVTGLEGLGKIPLMYQQGVDSARAQQFDEARAIEDQKTMQGVQDYQKQKDTQAQKDNAVKTYLEMAGKDKDAANQFYTNSPMLQQTLGTNIQLKDKMDKNGWLTFDHLNDDGTRKETTAINLGGIPEAQKKLQEKGILQPTLDQLAEAMPPGWAIKQSGAAKPADNKDPEITSNIVQDSESKTGWSYVDKSGQIIAKNAEPPKKPANGNGGSGNGDRKEFRTWVSQLDGLYRNRAAIEKGIDPFTGKEIPQPQIDTAKATINREIQSKEQFISSEFPDQWKNYRIPDVQGTPIASHGPAQNRPVTPAAKPPLSSFYR